MRVVGYVVDFLQVEVAQIVAGECLAPRPAKPFIVLPRRL